MKPAFLLRILLLVSVNLAILVVLLEIGGNLFFALENGRFFYTGARPKLDSYPDTNPFMSGEVRVVLHPYFGYGFKLNANMAARLPHVTFNNHGFLQSADYVRRNPACCDYPSVRSEPNEVIVGVFGGSVAASLAVRMQETPTFTKALNAIPRFTNKPIRILSFALGGHKQPQQLMILTYYLSLGQPLDMIINVDGYNEIATAPGNVDAGTDSNFPGLYMWRRLVDYLDRQANQAHNPEGVLANYHLIMTQRWARHAGSCRTATCYSLARLVQFWHQNNSIDVASTTQASPAAPSFFQVDPPAATTQNRYDFAADRWGTASEVMQQLSRARNMLYLHVLQPNQWFRRKSPYSPRRADELAAYFNRIVPLGYAAFVAKGARLRESGVNFLDASAVLDDEPSSIYSDDVGHYVPKGYDILWLAVVQALAAPELR